ncbi:85/88 kDa calcium-independent phospholipase A2 [Elysia marginata]|uniref:85/88 kDa calcium-independent phospholipase A2 n=1 Tax=Elysia marginata TaxID=1093978 RepID=A0AAV4FUA8_9GAST|nr:85/88 kDa calcium-independent phospholipase A2 [Elysia marginata]
MSDDEDAERPSIITPWCRNGNLTAWFMPHVLKHNGERNLDLSRLKHVVRYAKSLHPDFFESPTIGFCAFRCVQMSYRDVIVCLVQEGISPNLLFRGRTMLHEAVRISNEAMVRFLLTLPGINKNAYDDDSKTAVMYAVKGKPQCLKILLEAGCDISLVDRNGKTAFHVAINAPQAHPRDITACLNLLWMQGANINQRGAHGKTCLQRAIESNMQWLLAWLIVHNCDLNSPINNKRVKTFYSHEKQKCYNFSSPFLLACQMKNRKIVEVLISVGCKFRPHIWLLEYTRPVLYLHESLSNAFQQVTTLRLLCRKVLRDCLSTDIVAESCQLGLPEPLRCFLLCHDELNALGILPVG